MDMVTGIVVRVLFKYVHEDVPQILADDQLRADLKLDSLDLAELVMAIEEEFHITLPDDIERKWIKVSDIIETVKLNFDTNKSIQQENSGADI